jgi:hypothetical protein
MRQATQNRGHLVPGQLNSEANPANLIVITRAELVFAADTADSFPIILRAAVPKDGDLCSITKKPVFGGNRIL